MHWSGKQRTELVLLWISLHWLILTRKKLTFCGEWLKSRLKQRNKGFPGGAVVKNLPASAGDMGLSPGPGRSHMPRNNKARAPQLLSLCSRAYKPQLLSISATTTEACAPRACALQQEKPPNEKTAHHMKSSPCSLQVEKARAQQ